MGYQYSDSKHIHFVTIILFIVFTQQAKSQRTDDIGLFLGGSFYMGDVNPDKLFYNPSPAYGIRYRYNYNPMFSMSYGFTRGKLKANDKDFDSFLFQHYRNYSFDNNYINDFSAQIEYNLFPVTGDKERTEKMSPYIKLGLSVFYNSYKPHIQMAVPFALGIKYKLTKKIEIAPEWSFRRTFTDKLDDMKQYYSAGIFNNRQRSFLKTRDWYSFFGINLHYNLKKTNLKCPAYSNFQ